MNRIRRRKIYSAFNLVLLAILGIAAAIGIMYFVQYFEMLVVSLAVLIVFLFSIASISIIRSLKSVENESFDQGMYAVMESVPMVCSLYDKDNNIKYCNDEAPKLFGFTDKQKYSEHYNDSFPEFQPNGKRSEDMATEMIGKIMETGKGTVDWWQKTATGELIPLHLHCVGIFFRGEEHLLEFTKDKRQALEMQKKEEALKERMQIMLDSSPLLCVLFDENSNIVDVNREVVNLLGAPDRQTYINSPSTYRPEFQSGGIRSDEKSVQLLKEIAETGFARYEWNYIHQNGSMIPTEEILRRINVAGRDMLISYSRDLREHYASKEREEQVQKSIISMMNQLNNHVNEQSAAVAESAAAIEEMVANVHSVTLALTKNAEQVTALQAASGVGHSGLNEVAFDIRQIAEESEALLGINSIMQNIASKTNLLSMNAAIEAAHAGESGRGFSFVATEVRTLAESSGEQSKSIGGVLKRIKSSIDKVTKSIESVLGKFNTIDSGIKDVAEQERLVLDAMGEQQRGSEQMFEAINQLNEITHRVKTDSQDMAKRYQQSA
ncbi:MAG: PAS domain-containing methyl-accepting chemotaxis protein [Treponema sp.]|jgi:PAS domain-containing protein|nr:PAS domain-containing methyl-accepting chemotaxis protein [Treponema sp.]